jgi:F-type H+-transporting ATPase subunit b
MPQFDPHVFVPQIAWLIVIFTMLFLVVRAALPKVAAVETNRAGVIGGDLGRAEIAKEQAATVIAGYEATLATARAQAVKLAGDAKTAASVETAAQLKVVDSELTASGAKSDAEIAAARSAALANLLPVTEEATGDIVERLTGRRPAPAQIASTVAAVAA